MSSVDAAGESGPAAPRHGIIAVRRGAVPRPVRAAVAAALSRTPAPLILIDGPAGAGKTTLAAALAARWPGHGRRPILLHMDDLYPGWSGLARGSRTLATGVLAPRARGRAGVWRRYDWEAGAPGAAHEIPPEAPLIVEGCGTLSRAASEIPGLRIWVDADDAARKRRALRRDRGGFDAHWDMWQRQFERYARRDDPAARADLVLRAS